MYAGKTVEEGPRQDIFDRPMHPNTQGLLRCIPVPGKTKRGERLGSVPGVVPSLVGDLKGCMFRNRCPHASELCERGDMSLQREEGAHAHACLRPVADRMAELEAAE